MAEEHRRLNSWKEIAEYLGRDVRTVIRWEKEKGLPVHRLRGKRTAVVAYRDEIDSWMLGSNACLPVPRAFSGPADGSAPFVAAGDKRTPAAWKTVFLAYRSSRWKLAVPVVVAVLAFGSLLGLLERPSLSASSFRMERPLRFSRADYEASSPRGLVAGDFNGDGEVDLAFTNGREGVAVLLGDGHGIFSKRVVSPSKIPVTERLVAADFNGDGILDLAVTSYDGGTEIEVLLGRGDGSFTTQFHYDVGGRARWIAAGHMDSDGKLDLVVAASLASQIVVLRGQGDGSFREGGQYEAEFDVSALALVDVNRDGFTDVIASDYRRATSASISIYLNDGTGTLGKRQRYATGRGPLGLAAADFNQDGHVDLVTANFPVDVSVLLGQERAGFSEPATLAAGRGNGYVVAADLDRDGDLDLAVLGEHSNTVTVFFGDGRGGFERSGDFDTGGYPDAAVVADFDHDQRPDLATANIQGSSISVFLNRTQTSRLSTWLFRFASRRSS